MSDLIQPINSESKLTNVILFYFYFQKNREINLTDILRTFTENNYTGKHIKHILGGYLVDIGFISYDNGKIVRLTEKGVSNVARMIDSGEYGREVLFAKKLLEQRSDIMTSGISAIHSDVTETRFQKEYGIELKDALKYFSDQKLRIVLRRDILNAHKCLTNELWKPSIILSGGIIEAIFLQEINKHDPSVIQHAFSRTKYNRENFNEQKFQHLIAVVEQLRLFHTSLTQLSNVVRGFRNYVHIDRELKENIVFDRNYAEITFRSMINILKELK